MSTSWKYYLKWIFNFLGFINGSRHSSQLNLFKARWFRISRLNQQNHAVIDHIHEYSPFMMMISIFLRVKYFHRNWMQNLDQLLIHHFRDSAKIHHLWNVILNIHPFNECTLIILIYLLNGMLSLSSNNSVKGKRQVFKKSLKSLKHFYPQRAMF